MVLKNESYAFALRFRLALDDDDDEPREYWRPTITTKSSEHKNKDGSSSSELASLIPWTNDEPGQVTKVMIHDWKKVN